MKWYNLHLLLLLIMTVSLSAFQLEIGTPESIIADVINQNTRSTSKLILPTCCGGDITLAIETFSYEDGYLAVGGKVANRPETKFNLNGDENWLYGWIHFIDSDEAYRYITTGTGAVVVEQVPTSEILVINTMKPVSVPVEVEPVEHIQQQEYPPIIHLGPCPADAESRNLQSRPDSDKLILLDIDSKGVATSKTTESIWTMWQYVASGLSMYDVNVTTNKDLYDATPSKDRGLDMMYPNSGGSMCYVGCFGGTSKCNCYWVNGDVGAGKTTIHETGHMLGVLDAGHVTQGTYFEGFQEFLWVPVMGNYWRVSGANAAYQWVKGEYAGATSAAKQPFFSSQYAGKFLALLPDDITTAKPLEFTETNELKWVSNYGRVGTEGDEDDFTFEIFKESGAVDIIISPIEALIMLDVHAQILDESENVVVENNDKAIRASTLKTTLQQGKYTLRIKGGAEGAPEEGFSNYGSVGYFGIAGTIDRGESTSIKATVVHPNHLASLSFKGNQCELSLNKSSAYTVELFGLNGKLVYKESGHGVAGRNVISLDRKNLGNSIFMSQITTDNGVFVSSISLVK